MKKVFVSGVGGLICLLVGLSLAGCKVGVVRRDELGPTATATRRWTPTDVLQAITTPVSTVTPTPRPSATPELPSLTVAPTDLPPPTSTPAPAVSDAPQVLAFTASPNPADPTGALTLSWNVRGVNSVTVQWSDKEMEQVIHAQLPAAGNLSVTVTDVHFMDGDQVQFFLAGNDAAGQALVTRSLRVPLQTDLDIAAFTARPDPVERGGTVTLAWDAPHADSVSLTRLSPEGIFVEAEATDLASSGSLALPVPEEYTISVTYYLGARDPNGVLRGAYLTVGILCPYEAYLAPTCPLTREPVPAAYQPFEGGHMIWRGDTREIYVLYHDRRYETFADTWLEGEPTGIDETPPPGLSTPVRGFGKLWATHPAVRQGLGWPMAEESGYTTPLETVRENFGRYPTTGVYFKLPDDRAVHLSGSYGQWEILP